MDSSSFFVSAASTTERYRQSYKPYPSHRHKGQDPLPEKKRNLAKGFAKPITRQRVVERTTGIEPAYSAWEADILPMNYVRILFYGFAFQAGAGDRT